LPRYSGAVVLNIAVACSSVQRVGSLYVRIEMIIAPFRLRRSRRIRKHRANPLKRLFCFARMRSANATYESLGASLRLVIAGEHGALRLFVHFGLEAVPVLEGHGLLRCRAGADLVDQALHIGKLRRLVAE